MRGTDVYLRPLEIDDIPRTTRWLSDPAISVAVDVLPRSRAHQEQWFQRATLDPSKFIFAVCLVADDAHIGSVALTAVDLVHRHAMLSAFIAVPEHRGQGRGTQAVRLLLAFAFHRLNLHRVYLKTSLARPGVAAFYEQLGFVREGVWRQHALVGRVYEDRVLYGLLAEEFEARGDGA